jgi:MFS family permease
MRWSQAWMLFMAASLGVLTLLGYASPWVLLALTFRMGFGGAISLPAWQATVQDIVPKAWVASAVSLNSISFNVARAIGPALGGLIVAVFGAAFAFFANAASFLAVLAAVVLWRRPPVAASRLSEDVLGAIRAGFRYLLMRPGYRLPSSGQLLLTLRGSGLATAPLFARDVRRRPRRGYSPLGAFDWPDRCSNGAA